MCVCIKLMTIKYTNTITNVDTHILAHSHAQQVIQISKANSELRLRLRLGPRPRPRHRPRQQDCANILPATETKTYYYSMLPMCVCASRVCVRVCGQIEFDLLKFDIFRDTSTANQANTSPEQRQDESDRPRNNQARAKNVV